MCEEDSVLKRILTPIFSGSASGTVKAAPAIGVSALSIAGVPLESWVTILTLVYILIMIVGALPKIVETCRFFYQLWKPRKIEELVCQVSDDAVAKKIEKVKGGRDA